MNLSSKINTIISDIIKNLYCQVCKIKVDSQKISDSKLETLTIVIAFFLIEDKKKKSCIF